VLRSTAAGSPDEFSGDVLVYDESGVSLLEIEGLQLRRSRAVPASESAQESDLLYACNWTPAASTALTAGQPRRSWLILDGRTGVGKRLAEMLDQNGGRCRRIEAHSTDQLRRSIAQAFGKDPGIDTVVHLASLGLMAANGLTTEAQQSDQETAVRSALDLIQALARVTNGNRVQTFFITRGAVPITAKTITAERGAIAVSQSALWGFAKAA